MSKVTCCVISVIAVALFVLLVALCSLTCEYFALLIEKVRFTASRVGVLNLFYYRLNIMFSILASREEHLRKAISLSSDKLEGSFVLRILRLVNFDRHFRISNHTFGSFIRSCIELDDRFDTGMLNCFLFNNSDPTLEDFFHVELLYRFEYRSFALFNLARNFRNLIDSVEYYKKVAKLVVQSEACIEPGTYKIIFNCLFII
jgi:hypothetical protein